MKIVMMMLSVMIMMPWMPCTSACHADERNSLLDLKEGLNFTSSHYTLQSWKGFNCCAWEGVTCHPITAHVVSLDLSPQSLNASWSTDDDEFPWPFMSWRELRGGRYMLLVMIMMMPWMPCTSACHADERNSLLGLKEGLNFTSSFNTLQSWKGFNCCAWEGVTCHPITAHVISLDLSPRSLNASITSHSSHGRNFVEDYSNCGISSA